MFYQKVFYLFLLVICSLSCKKIHHSEIHSLSDDEYPDNPDIGFRSEKYNTIKYSNIRFVPEEGPFEFSIELVDQNNQQHKLILQNINLEEFVPTRPSWIKNDNYLSKIGIINQEWNRQQVKFTRAFKGLSISGNEFEENNLSRVDIARNCLSSFKWEVILYSKENGIELPYYHGWFNFPEDFYTELFEQKNGESFSDYETHMTEWLDPENEMVNFELLRTLKESKKVYFQNYNNRLYALKGEREKKAKNILTPINYSSIQDLLTDSTTFATFTNEGLYDVNDARNTELGRLASIDSIVVSAINSPNGENDNLHEIKLYFTHSVDSVKTEFVIGGINLQDLPRLLESDVDKGWQNSMGIANHSFYDTYEHTISNSCSRSPYYAMLTDQYQNWIDSHKIGVDGPLLFLDKRNPKNLHLFILSFERHAFVGHYLISLNNIPT